MDATFMTALNIVNVRHLKNITIPLSATERRPIILTGKNGSGKNERSRGIGEFPGIRCFKQFLYEGQV